MNKIKIQNEETSPVELGRVPAQCQAHSQAAEVEHPLCGSGAPAGPIAAGPHCRASPADTRRSPH